MTRHDRATRPAPWLLDGAAAVVSRLAHRYPHFFVQPANRDKSLADVRWLSMPSVRQSAADNLQAALRDGAWGYIEAIRGPSRGHGALRSRTFAFPSSYGTGMKTPLSPCTTVNTLDRSSPTPRCGSVGEGRTWPRGTTLEKSSWLPRECHPLLDW